MSENALSDGGQDGENDGGAENGPDATGVNATATDSDRWNAAGREAVASLLWSARADVDDQIRILADEMRNPNGRNPTPQDVRELRRALNELRRIVEERLAPAAGVDPWSEPHQSVPYGVARRVYCRGEGDADEEGDDE